MKYFLKKTRIEAVQWTGENFEEVKKFVKDNVSVQGGWIRIVPNNVPSILIAPGEYIVKQNGNFNCCGKEYFESNYEKVN